MRRLFFYCQHSLGLGHLTRAWLVADALSSHFSVKVWCGGPLPDGLAAPSSCEIAALPALAADAEGRLASLDCRYTVEMAFDRRRDHMVSDVVTERPAAIVFELFPFGRKKFDRELLPVLEAARALRPQPVVVCSLRDILVGRGDDQTAHDDRARTIVDQYFDGVLVHADQRFARLEESFHPRQSIRTPVYYTGFVARTASSAPASNRSGILVTGGGGRFAESLFMTAIAAQKRRAAFDEIMTIVAGPLCEESTWQRLCVASAREPSIRLQRSLTDVPAAMASSGLSISQCGYNTALDIVSAGVPALVVPFADRGETEQTERASRLEALGVVRVLPADRLTASALVAAIDDTLQFSPMPLALDCDGAARTAQLINDLVHAAGCTSSRLVSA